MTLELQYYADRPGRDLTIPGPGSVVWGDWELGCFQVQQDLRDFGSLVTSMGLRYGTYCNRYSLQTGEAWGDSTELSPWPLFYADYRAPDFATFVPFNGFTLPALWQWSSSGYMTPAGLVNADVSLTPDGRLFLDISNWTTLTTKQAEFIKYAAAGVVIGLQDAAKARRFKALLS